MCNAYYDYLNDLRRIRQFLSVETVALLANSMISSRLDYCNSLLNGISKYNVTKLQKIQNAICKIVLDFIELAMSLPFFQKLHLIPITYRILLHTQLSFLASWSHPPLLIKNDLGRPSTLLAITIFINSPVKQ